MKGIEHLRRARTLVTGTDGDARRRLQSAAHLWWTAMFDYESWPNGMRFQAKAVQSRLFRRGVIDETIAAMSDAEVREAAESLRQFCDFAERVNESRGADGPG